jgi:hypothetical protein
MKREDVQLTDLLQRAEEYATFAEQHFMLDAADVEQKPELDEAAELAKIIHKLEVQHPDLYHASERDKFMIHFLFPNLGDKDRLLVASIHSMCWAVKLSRANGQSEQEDRARLAKYLEDAREAQLESRLTEIQIRLLESDWADPDSDLSAGY